MAKTCKSMMEKYFLGIALAVAGLVIVVLGVLIVVEPRILAWVTAAVLLFLGVMILLMTCFIRKFGEQFRRLT